MVGGPPARVSRLRPEGLSSRNVAVGPYATLSGAIETPPAYALPATPSSTTYWSPSKSRGAEDPAPGPATRFAKRAARGVRDTGATQVRGDSISRKVSPGQVRPTRTNRLERGAGHQGERWATMVGAGPTPTRAEWPLHSSLLKGETERPAAGSCH